MQENGKKQVVLIIVCLSSFITPFMGSSINIALPAIGQEFQLDAIFLSWIPTAYLLASAMFLLPFGRTADIYGRKKIFFLGTVVFVFGSILSGLAMSGWTLLISRIIQGIGGSMTFGTGMAILTSVYAPHERGKALGITVGTVYSGLSLGPFFGGLLTQHFTWRSIFFLAVPFGLAIVLLILLKLPEEWADAKGETLDIPGSFLFAVMLLLLMVGLSNLPNIEGFILIVVGIGCMVLFFWWENTSKSPLFHVRLFRKNIVFIFSNLAALIHYSSSYCVTFLLSLYLQYTKGLDPQHAGMILVAQPIMMALCSPFAGKLSDRIEPKIVASIGMAMLCAALFFLSFISLDTSIVYIVCILIPLGFGFGLFSSPNTNAVMSSVEKQFLGVASGTLSTMRTVGQMFSMGLVIMIFSIFIGKMQITPDLFPALLKSIRISFIVCGSLCFVGIFFSLARGKVR